MMQGFHTLTPREYHADPAPAPSLSSTVAKVMIQQTPRHAWLMHPRLGGEADSSDPTRPAEIGSAAHAIITGVGEKVVVIDGDDYKKKDAKEARAAAYEAGHIPILQPDLEKAEALAKTVRERIDIVLPGMVAGAKGEQVILWQDAAGVWGRGMIDLWHEGSLTAYDVKSVTSDLSDRAIANRIVGGWDIQAGLYMRGLTTLMPESAGRIKWRWIVVEQSPPHEVRVIEADRTTLEIGDRKAAMAISKWAHCLVHDNWPGYPPTIKTIEYPTWELSRWEEREIDEPMMEHFAPISQAPTTRGMIEELE